MGRPTLLISLGLLGYRPGIEPCSLHSHCSVLPNKLAIPFVNLAGIEPAPRDSNSRMLPLHYRSVLHLGFEPRLYGA